MKIAMYIVRTLMGLLFIFSSVTYLTGLIQPPPMEGPIKEFNDGLAASGYFMPLLKITELICGILLLSGRFVPLALVILAPIVVNIFFVHLTIAREGLPIAVIVVAMELFLAYYYRDAFAPLFKSTHELR
jgi:putative oxidoreductase